MRDKPKAQADRRRSPKAARGKEGKGAEGASDSKKKKQKQKTADRKPKNEKAEPRASTEAKKKKAKEGPPAVRKRQSSPGATRGSGEAVRRALSAVAGLSLADYATLRRIEIAAAKRKRRAKPMRPDFFDRVFPKLDPPPPPHLVKPSSRASASSSTSPSSAGRPLVHTALLVGQELLDLHRY